MKRFLHQSGAVGSAFYRKCHEALRSTQLAEALSGDIRYKSTPC